MNSKTRREFIKQAGLLGVGLFPIQLVNTKRCLVTPPQTEGPFYPLKFPRDSDSDLTVFQGKKKLPLGKIIVITGRVFNLNCQPVKGATIEIWQACASGKYNHEYDSNSAPLDPNFQYWSRLQTDKTGRYQFKTVKPGAYPVTETWMRPPHIHFKISVSGKPLLTTQLYFADEEKLNRQDRILQRLSYQQRSLVITSLQENKALGLSQGQFNLVLGFSQSQGLTPMIS